MVFERWCSSVDILMNSRVQLNDIGEKHKQYSSVRVSDTVLFVVFERDD